jgi:two-component system OmpR family response regulator
MPVLILTALGRRQRPRARPGRGRRRLHAQALRTRQLEGARARASRAAAWPAARRRCSGTAYLRPGRPHCALNGDAIELSAREVSLLEILLQRAGRLVSKDQLVGHLCEWGEEVSGNAIEVYVHRLRKKLEPGGVRIVTVRGLGYSLEKTAA